VISDFWGDLLGYIGIYWDIVGYNEIYWDIMGLMGYRHQL
jgi:phosphatidate phosphatase PAH1